MLRIDKLIDKMTNTQYGTGDNKQNLLYSFQPDKITATRVVVSEWVQDVFLDEMAQTAALKQRVMFLEEMVKKSNFAPFVEKKDPTN